MEGLMLGPRFPLDRPTPSAVFRQLEAQFTISEFAGFGRHSKHVMLCVEQLRSGTPYLNQLTSIPWRLSFPSLRALFSGVFLSRATSSSTAELTQYRKPVG